MTGKEKSYTMRRIKEVAAVKVMEICREEPFPCSEYDATNQNSYSYSTAEAHTIQAMKKVGVKMMSPAEFIKRCSTKGDKHLTLTAQE